MQSSDPTNTVTFLENLRTYRIGLSIWGKTQPDASKTIDRGQQQAHTLMLLAFRQMLLEEKEN